MVLRDWSQVEHKIFASSTYIVFSVQGALRQKRPFAGS
jgi:hypothetical protein